MHYYFDVFKKYAVFSGRSSRSEYWYFTLFNFIAYMAIIILVSVVSSVSGVNIAVLILIYILAVFIPGLAVSVRRLHDIGRNGWWLLVSFIPLAGAIILLIFYMLESQSGENEYGLNPKDITMVTNL